MTDTTESTFLERLLTQRERIAGDLDQLDNRELTAREVEQRDTLERQLSETSTRIDDERDRLDRLEQANRTFHEHAAKPVTGPSKPVDPDAWRSVHTLVAEQRSGGLDVSRRAFVGGLTDEIVSPNLVSGIYPTAQPSILELFQRGEADGPVQRVYRAGTAATAGQVAEGDPKPDAGLTLEPVDIPMQKLATLQKVSDELRSDYSGFANAIPNELSRAIREQENAYAMSIINADSNVDTATASNVIDGTADAIASLYASSGQAASGMVLNPLDLASARKSKADTAGGYHLDPTSAAPMTLHGVPIVVSNSIDSGTVLVGAFESAGICFHRDAMRVAVGHSGDDFERNLTSVIVEERLGLGLTRPAFLTLLSISAA